MPAHIHTENEQDVVVYLTDEERAQAIRCLKVARGKVASGKETFICRALPFTDVGDKLSQAIDLSLRGHATIGVYLTHKGFQTTDEQRRRVRIEWLTDWIESLAEPQP